MKHTYYTDRFVQQCDNDTKRTRLKQGIEINKATEITTTLKVDWEHIEYWAERFKEKDKL